MYKRQHFTDGFAGPQSFDVDATVGDFLVATKAQLPAYQLAVVIDDHRAGVTDVIRGDDLLPSTARQKLVADALGLPPPPRYFHVPLVLGPTATAWPNATATPVWPPTVRWASPPSVSWACWRSPAA